jgi:hypothetical protein
MTPQSYQIRLLFALMIKQANGKPKTAKPIRTLGDALSDLIRARDGSRITCGRGDVSLDARHFRRRECLATRFDSRNIAGHCTKENRLKGGDQEFSLAIGTGTQQQRLPPSNVTQELDQLTSSAWVRPPFAILLDTLSAWHFSRFRFPVSQIPSTTLNRYSN